MQTVPVVGGVPTKTIDDPLSSVPPKLFTSKAPLLMELCRNSGYSDERILSVNQLLLSPEGLVQRNFRLTRDAINSICDALFSKRAGLIILELLDGSDEDKHTATMLYNRLLLTRFHNLQKRRVLLNRDRREIYGVSRRSYRELTLLSSAQNFCDALEHPRIGFRFDEAIIREATLWLRYLCPEQLVVELPNAEPAVFETGLMLEYDSITGLAKFWSFMLERQFNSLYMYTRQHCASSGKMGHKYRTRTLQDFHKHLPIALKRWQALVKKLPEAVAGASAEVMTIRGSAAARLLAARQLQLEMAYSGYGGRTTFDDINSSLVVPAEADYGQERTRLHLARCLGEIPWRNIRNTHVAGFRRCQYHMRAFWRAFSVLFKFKLPRK